MNFVSIRSRAAFAGPSAAFAEKVSKSNPPAFTVSLREEAVNARQKLI